MSISLTQSYVHALPGFLAESVCAPRVRHTFCARRPREPRTAPALPRLCAEPVILAASYAALRLVAELPRESLLARALKRLLAKAAIAIRQRDALVTELSLPTGMAAGKKN
jgi:hypothetical protein